MQSWNSNRSFDLLLLLRAILRWGPFGAVRRNHALEHATVHVLQEQFQRLRVSGLSTERGFVLIGDIPTAATEKAAFEALNRLRAGQHQLAIHPQCGTNFVVQGILCTMVGFFGFAGIGWRRAFIRLNQVSILMLLAALFSPLLGMTAQSHITTDSQVGALRITSVEQRNIQLPLIGTITIHTVRTHNR